MTHAHAMHLCREADAAELEALRAEAHLGRFIMVYLDMMGHFPTGGDVLRRNVADARTKRDIARRLRTTANAALDEVAA